LNELSEAFAARGETFTFSRIGKFQQRLLETFIAKFCGQPRMMTIDGEGDERLAMVSGVGRSRGPMVNAVDARIAETGLEACGVFPEVMQQAGEAGFAGCIEGGGEFGGVFGDVPQMNVQRLPLRFVEVARAIRMIGSVGVIGHCGGSGRGNARSVKIAACGESIAKI
jgi:hypothetical protein